MVSLDEWKRITTTQPTPFHSYRTAFGIKANIPHMGSRVNASPIIANSYQSTLTVSRFSAPGNSMTLFRAGTPKPIQDSVLPMITTQPFSRTGYDVRMPVMLDVSRSTRHAQTSTRAQSVALPAGRSSQFVQSHHTTVTNSLTRPL